MPLVKTQKNKAYYKRFQVKPRRRREGKTDYKARLNMLRQDKNKYATPKHRLAVRFTNSQVVCQISRPTIQGDIIECMASSAELPLLGCRVGLKNYAAAYCTGLLLARRMLKSLNMDKTYKGVEEVDGEEFHVEEDEEGDRKPFKCVLDVGIRRTTLGNRVFGALKGAVDGGLHVPHSVKKFPGFTKSEGKGQDDKYDAEAHKEKIIAGHVCDYMEAMKENDEEKYKRHFSKYLDAGLDGDALEDMLLATHKAIRADPTFKGLARLTKKDGGKRRKLLPATKPAPKSSSYKAKNTRTGQVITTNSGSYTRPIKLSLAQRKDRVAQKWEVFRNKIAAAQADEDDE